MTLTCRICQRVNPPDALFCHHDGVPLDGQGGPIAVSRLVFPTPFVFPSGKTCRSFDELVVACDSHWGEAREMFQKGFLESFLGGLGRVDLARAAGEAARAGDLDRGLDQLLAQLPSSARTPAVLHVEPREVNLGRVRRDSAPTFNLELRNAGMGLLHGDVSCAESWLAVGAAPAGPRKIFQTRDSVTIPVQVLGKALRAGPRPIEGRLVVQSSGGKAEVVVRVEMPVQPFSGGVLAGASSPRELALKARSSPRDAAPLFAQGAVAGWYEANGWTYPVQGPSADGLGAVQQFFEALGLVVPPRVSISSRQVALQGNPGARLDFSLVVQTLEKRPVFAHATTNVSWLKPGAVQMRGQKASIPVGIPSVPDTPGQVQKGKVFVQANGDQRFTVEVDLTVTGSPSAGRRSAPVVDLPAAAPDWLFSAPVEAPPSRPGSKPSLEVPSASPRQAASSGIATATGSPIAVAPVAVSAVAVAPVAVVPASSKREAVGAPESSGKGVPPWVRHLLPLGALVFVLFLAVIHDLLLPAEEMAHAETSAAGGGQTLLGVRFHDGSETDRRMPEPTMRFGLVMLQAEDPRNPGRLKRLTFDEWGRSNNTCVKVDGGEYLFGHAPGAWVQRGQPLDASGADPGRGLRSIWALPIPNIEVTQEVELLRGDQSGALDTCLVRYTLKNKDSRPHRAGLRFLLDTYIGANDGVPFTIPGSSELCSTMRRFDTPAAIPDYVEALEFEDLKNPGTIARLQLRLGKQLEPPGRVLLGGWPDPELKRLGHRGAEAQVSMWEVPFVSIRELHDSHLRLSGGARAAPDSAVTMYWEEKPLPPGDTRVVGFTYGLGSVSSDAGGGKLALSLGGRLVRDGELSLTALVHEPSPGEKLTLRLPSGLSLLSGEEEEAVPPVPPGALRPISTVSWKIRADQAGPTEITVVSSRGHRQTLKLNIRSRGVFD